MYEIYNCNKLLFAYYLLKYPQQRVSYVYKCSNFKGDYDYGLNCLKCSCCLKIIWVHIYDDCEYFDPFFKCPECNQTSTYNSVSSDDVSSSFSSVKPTMKYYGILVKNYNLPYNKNNNKLFLGKRNKRGRSVRTWVKFISVVNKSIINN